jgi:hypothetical protein
MIKKINFTGPIISGSVSIAKGQCGKRKCSCKARLPRLHGPYYRWTGFINGKRTTKTISEDIALECKRRIKNYRKLQGTIEKILSDAMKYPPWAIKKSKTEIIRHRR